MDLGKGFQRWKTIPTRCLKATMSSDGSYTLSPSRQRSPSWRTPGIRSFNLLIDRRKVDFPHPDGPISAVTARAGMARVIPFSACFFPYQNEKLRASIVPTTLGGVVFARDAAAVIRTVR